MRLWHKDLIHVLPRKQLLSQWRECCCIARNIAENGTPNHILVNKIMDYPMSHFNVYAIAVYNEMTARGYHCDFSRFRRWWVNRNRDWEYNEIFPEWHTDRYLRQCYYNLEEKYDCGGISDEEWFKLHKFVVDNYLIM